MIFMEGERERKRWALCKKKKKMNEKTEISKDEERKKKQNV